MPVETPMSEPVEAAGKFLTDLETVLTRIVQEADAIFPDELSGLMRAAWSPDSNADDAPASVVALFRALHRSLEDVSAQAWIDAGLTGRHLAYKVAAVAWAKQGIEGALDDFKNKLTHVAMPHFDVRQKARKKVAAAVATGLAVFDVVLDSMPIPGKEIIKEFKGIAETTAAVVANLPDEEPMPA